ncbi:MAG: hypothetical protein KIT31_36285 [Deltaproteobacteria bacterium]|nr:hypothetical protein [Deltaproteobacteria bacterium]
MTSRALFAGAAGCAVLCAVYVLPGGATPREAVAPPRPIEAPRTVTAPPVPALPEVVAAPAIDLGFDLEAAIELDDDTIHGMAQLEDPALFSFVFHVDGEHYVRLSTSARATRHGTPRLIDGEYVVAVVAPVDAAALPEELRGWAGRKVLVDGACTASVVGFAEVSRVNGDPPGAWDEGREEPARWTAEAAREDNIVLAARIEGCATGTWARAATAPAAPIARSVEEPAVANAARADLLARRADDPYQTAWADANGEGDWRDAVEVTSEVFEHGATGERWVIARAKKDGGCGDPYLDRAVVYRTNDDGSVRRVAELDHLSDKIHSLVDLDDDGQPELVLGEGDRARVIDLLAHEHDSIDIPFHGCGC